MSATWQVRLYSTAPLTHGLEQAAESDPQRSTLAGEMLRRRLEVGDELRRFLEPGGCRQAVELGDGRLRLPKRPLHARNRQAGPAKVSGLTEVGATYVKMGEDGRPITGEQR